MATVYCAYHVLCCEFRDCRVVSLCATRTSAERSALTEASLSSWLGSAIPLKITRKKLPTFCEERES